MHFSLRPLSIILNISNFSRLNKNPRKPVMWEEERSMSEKKQDRNNTLEWIIKKGYLGLVRKATGTVREMKGRYIYNGLLKKSQLEGRRC